MFERLPQSRDVLSPGWVSSTFNPVFRSLSLKTFFFFFGLVAFLAFFVQRLVFQSPLPFSPKKRRFSLSRGCSPQSHFLIIDTSS